MYSKTAKRDKKGKLVHQVSRLTPEDQSAALSTPSPPASASSASTRIRHVLQFTTVLAVMLERLRAYVSTAVFLSLNCVWLLQDFQSTELPSTRIQPDRRWFGNTRVVGQQQLEKFRDEMSSKVGTFDS